MLYRAAVNTPVRGNPDPGARKSGDLMAGSTVDITDQRNGYGYFQNFQYHGWVAMSTMIQVGPAPTPDPTPEPIPDTDDENHIINVHFSGGIVRVDVDGVAYTAP